MAACHASREFLDREGADVAQRSQYWAGFLCTVVGYMSADTSPEAARLVLEVTEKSLPLIHRKGLKPVPGGGQ